MYDEETGFADGDISGFDDTAVRHGTVTYQFINPLYTGGLFHCYLLDESICHFRGVRSILSLEFYF